MCWCFEKVASGCSTRPQRKPTAGKAHISGKNATNGFPMYGWTSREPGRKPATGNCGSVAGPFPLNWPTDWSACSLSWAIRSWIHLWAPEPPCPLIESEWGRAIEQGRRRISQRFDDHRQFVRGRAAAGKAIKHANRVYGFPVVTRQETELMIPLPVSVQQTEPNQFSVSYDLPEASADGQPSAVPKTSQPKPAGQLTLFDRCFP
jgi:hypothetical protein